MQSLGLTAIHYVDFTCFQGIGSGSGIRNADYLHLVKVGAALLEVVWIALANEPDTGLPAHHAERTGTHTFLIFFTCRTGRHDRNMVVAGDEGEVGVAFLQREYHRVLAIGLDVHDRLSNAFGSRFRIFAAMVVVGVDDIISVYALAVVKLDAFAKLENPFRRIGRGLPAFGQFRKGIAFIVNFDQVTP